MASADFNVKGNLVVNGVTINSDGTTLNLPLNTRINNALFQEKLVSEINIKTINSQSILGSGDITIGADTASVTAAGALMDNEVTNLAAVKTFNPTDYATASQGNLADSAQQPPVEGAFVDGDKNKLDGIESGATADQTAVEIKTAYESNSNTNAFTDAEQDKLSGIETGADVTDTTNVTAAGALMDSELTDIASVKALDQGVATTDSPEFNVVTATSFVGDGSSLTGLPSGYTDADVDSHLNQSTATADQVLTWDGSDYAWEDAGGGGFAPTTVSGASQSLDLGSFNFFDAGTLTADTTISFTNVPTEARWSYTFIGFLSEAYSIENASYDSVSFDVSSEDTQPQGIHFKPDGTKMFMVGENSDRVHSYTLSAPWDISTASYDSVFLDVSSEDIRPQGIDFKPDGTKMFIIGVDSDSVHSYTLSTSWDLSTASYDNVSFDVSSEALLPNSIHFKPDGTQMFIVDNFYEAVFSYTLLTPWDILTASYDSVSFDVSSENSSPDAIHFKPDGTKMIMAGRSSDSVHSYTLSTSWDLSTASYDNVSLSVLSEDGFPTGIHFKPDGTKMFMVGGISDTVYQYSTSVFATITLPASIQNPPTDPFTTEKVTYEFYTLDGGTNVYLINEEVL